MITDLAEGVQRRRSELGLSQADLAIAAGVGVRQIRRYEAGEQLPLLGIAVRLATALRMSVDELAGLLDRTSGLTGDWHAAWRLHGDTQDAIEVEPVQIRQDGDRLRITSPEIDRSLADRRRPWTGELRLWDDGTLMGWCTTVDAEAPVRRTLYFVLAEDRCSMTGRWVGRGSGTGLESGAGSLARTPDTARARVDGAIGESGRRDRHSDASSACSGAGTAASGTAAASPAS